MNLSKTPLFLLGVAVIGSGIVLGTFLWLKRHGQRVGDDIFLTLFAVIDKLLFPLSRWEQHTCPLRRDFLTHFEKPD